MHPLLLKLKGEGLHIKQDHLLRQENQNKFAVKARNQIEKYKFIHKGKVKMNPVKTYQEFKPSKLKVNLSCA